MIPADGGPFQGLSDKAMPAKNTICLWYDGGAEDAARFYAETFPDTSVDAVHRAPGDFPSGKEGDVLTVEFTVMGIPCIGLNGGPRYKHSQAFSFQVATADQAETDRYWDAIVGNGGQEHACGWCQDRWGLCWQISPTVLTEAVAGGDPAAAKRAFNAMMPDEEDRRGGHRGGGPRLRPWPSWHARLAIKVVWRWSTVAETGGDHRPAGVVVHGQPFADGASPVEVDHTDSAARRGRELFARWPRLGFKGLPSSCRQPFWQSIQVFAPTRRTHRLRAGLYMPTTMRW